jgi:hypothetical protein
MSEIAVKLILDITGQFIISLAVALFSVYLFYISVSKIIRNKLISYFIFLTSLFSSSYLFGIIFPRDDTNSNIIYLFFYYYLRSFPIFLALALIVLLDIKNYQLKFRKK